MIGNDIVDLRLALMEDKASNQRWLQKVFTEKEIELLQTNENPNLLLWRLWSMKESAYKMAVKMGAERAFNPKKFETKIEGTRQGRVNSEWGNFQLTSFITEDLIHSVAAESFDNIAVSDQKSTDSEDLSAAVRKAFIISFQEHNPQYSKLAIEMENGIPFLYSGIEKCSTDISLSHHGKYVAWAFQRF